MSTVIKSENGKFECKFCLYETTVKKDYYKHLETNKHKQKIIINKNENINESIVSPPSPVYKKCECGKSYKHRQALYVHRKKCTFKIQNQNININDEKEDLFNDVNVKKMIFEMVEQNKLLYCILSEKCNLLEQEGKKLNEKNEKLNEKNEKLIDENKKLSKRNLELNNILIKILVDNLEMVEDESEKMNYINTIHQIIESMKQE